ncbi:MAG: hypothetical protein ABL855_00610, partial [Sideroxydans sp.]
EFHPRDLAHPNPEGGGLRINRNCVFGGVHASNDGTISQCNQLFFYSKIQCVGDKMGTPRAHIVGIFRGQNGDTQAVKIRKTA